MRNRCTLLAALALAAILAGCNQAPPPAPDTRQADAKAIRDLETAWSQAAATKDVDKFAAYYADDATALYDNMPIINGKEAIKAAMKPFFQDKNFSLTWATTKVEVARSGDIAYSQGTIAVTFTDPKTKKVMTEKGKYVEVYKKQADGGWKAVEDIWNADAPATAVGK
ncbi:MAG: SgcJ/EcaC family oxidoreductase [Terracidiphilus sp.]|jgi:uncharacterized protein (TIGR02246 family)